MQLLLQVIQRVGWDVSHGHCRNVARNRRVVVRLDRKHRDLIAKNIQSVRQTLRDVQEDLRGRQGCSGHKVVAKLAVETNLDQGGVGRDRADTTGGRNRPRQLSRLAGCCSGGMGLRLCRGARGLHQDGRWNKIIVLRGSWRLSNDMGRLLRGRLLLRGRSRSRDD